MLLLNYIFYKKDYSYHKWPCKPLGFFDNSGDAGWRLGNCQKRIIRAGRTIWAYAFL